MIGSYFNNKITIRINAGTTDKYGEIETTTISGVPARVILKREVIQTADDTEIETEGQFWISPHISIDPELIIQVDIGSTLYEVVNLDIVRRFNAIDHIKLFVKRVVS